MAEVTYYVALPFVAADDGIAAGEPTECFNPVAGVMRAEALSRKEGHVGAVEAFVTMQEEERRSTALGETRKDNFNGLLSTLLACMATCRDWLDRRYYRSRPLLRVIDVTLPSERDRLQMRSHRPIR